MPKVLWSKKCTKCSHPALEHKTYKPENESKMHYITVGGQRRYCHHPVPAGKDVYTFCLCEVEPENYVRVGNHAMIRLPLK